MPQRNSNDTSGAAIEPTLKLDEVARALDTDVPTVRKLIRMKALRALRVSPRITRVTQGALREFLRPR